MTILQDNIYGREIATGVRKSQVVIGRGGSGNARKSVSSVSTVSATSSTSATSSRFLGSLGSRGTVTGSEHSSRTRRWSSASDDFMSVINITQEVADSDRYDLYTISSHSTGTTESGALSDIPSFISEYTFKTSSNPSSRSRPSTMSINPSQQSGQSDWLARIPRNYSSESLPQTIISESVEAAMMMPSPQTAPLFRNPFSNNSSRSLAVYPTTRRSEIAPFDEPTDDTASINEQQQQSPVSKSPRRFKMFRKLGPRIDTQLTAYASSSRFGQSNETVNVRSASLSSPDSPISRRGSNSFARGLLLRVGSLGNN